MQNKKMNSFMRIGVFATAALSLFACDLKKSAKKTADSTVAAASKATKSCDTYKTENQADGENEVIRTGINYKFNLYWTGGSKLSVWENNVVDDSYTLDLNPPVIHVLNANGTELEKVTCKESKASAGKCVTRLEDVVKMIKDAKQALVDRNANLSDGKAMTFKCSEEYANKQITELNAFQATP